MAPLWLVVLLAILSVGSIAITARYYFHRLARPERPSPDEISFPSDLFKFDEYVSSIVAFGVTALCFYKGADWLLSWLPETLDPNLRFGVPFLLSFFGAVGLVAGVEHLGIRIRRGDFS